MARSAFDDFGTLPLFTPKSDWRPPSLSDLPDWSNVARVGLDTETKDPDIRKLGPGVRRAGCEMVGISFAFEDGPKYYLPFGHPDDGKNDLLPRENVLAYVRDQAKRFTGTIVGANLSYEIDWLAQSDIHFPAVERFADVLVADPLIYELHKRYNLDAVAKRRGFDGKDEALLRQAALDYCCDPKKDLYKMPARYVGPYAEEDAALPLRVLREQEKDMARDGIGRAWDMHCTLLPILVAMRRRGVRVNEDRLSQIEAWCRRQETLALDEVKRLTSVDIPADEVMNAKLLARALAVAGIPLSTFDEGMDQDALRNCDHIVAQWLVVARKVFKIRSTYIRGVRDHMTNGRIHCTFNQIKKTDDFEGGGTKGVAVGRLSAEHVNMQNQPSLSRSPPNDETGALWRCAYEADAGDDWLSCDLKQQEPKWSYHFCAMMKLPGAEEVCASLRANPKLDSYEPLVALTGQPRSACKIIWLSRCYGKGDGGLCSDLPPFGLNLPTRSVTFSNKRYRKALDEGRTKLEAKAFATIPADSDEGQACLERGSFEWEGAGEEGARIIKAFDESMPFLKMGADIAQRRAEERGYITLRSGRRLHFPKLDDGKYDKREIRKAFNKIIQGNSAEQTMEIMIAVCKTDPDLAKRMMLQVHDELAFSWPKGEDPERVAKIMREAVPMRVPTIIDCESGPSWGESMSVEYKSEEGKKWKKQYQWSPQFQLLPEHCRK